MPDQSLPTPVAGWEPGGWCESCLKWHDATSLHTVPHGRDALLTWLCPTCAARRPEARLAFGRMLVAHFGAGGPPRPAHVAATGPARTAVRDGDRVIAFHEPSLGRLTAETRGLPLLVEVDGEWVEETET